MGYLILFLLLIFLLATVIEWFVMLIMKFGTPGKTIVDSFQVNMVSFVLACILLVASVDVTNDAGVLIGFAIAVITEGLLLQALNKNKAAKKVWTTCIVMNLVTYFLFLII